MSTGTPCPLLTLQSDSVMSLNIIAGGSDPWVLGSKRSTVEFH